MLKYLNEVGEEHGVTMEMENDYGLTPVVYAMMNHKFYAFIYLYFKLKCPLEAERACWVITHMIKQQSNETKILQLILHDDNLGPQVAETALDQAVEHNNVDYLKTTLKHLYETNILLEPKLTALLETADIKEEIQSILELYLAMTVY